MKTFYSPLRELNEFNEVLNNLKKKNTPIQVTGCIDSQKCHFISGLSEDIPWKLIITYDEIKAKEIYEDYLLFDKDVFLYPAKDIIFYSADIHGNAIINDRLKILRRLIEKKPTTIITTIDSGLDKILPLSYIEDSIINISESSTINLKTLASQLVKMGYERLGQVERPGEFAIRGGIIDIFSPSEENPIRIELWGDEVDSIRYFEVDSQRSIENLESIVIYPASEYLLDSATIKAGLSKIEKEKEKQVKKLRAEMKTEEAYRLKSTVEEFSSNLENFSGYVGINSYIQYFYDETVSLFDYFRDDNSIIFVDEPNRVIEKAEAIETEFRESMISRLEKGYVLPGQIDAIYSYKELIAVLHQKNLILISTMDSKQSEFNVKEKFNLTVRSVNPYNNNFDILVKDLARWKKDGYRILLLSSSNTRAMRLSDDLGQEGLNAFYTKDLDRQVQGGEIMVSSGSLHRGFEYPFIKFVIISESDIFGRQKKKKRRKRSDREGQKIHSFAELSYGDYVIHENHGLGIYKGLTKLEVDGIEKDYLKIEYGDGGVLYILATALDLLQKYASSESKKPKLNKLNSPEWKKTKTRVKGAVKEIAKELVELYAIRSEKPGYQYSSDTVWQKEFEETFPYEETDDQLKAIEDTKKDMESNKIMDRLVCGDVGYGKTEIAIRAAFKAVMDGKQVAFLVPTTILAQQHYNNFAQRMKDYPINVDLLSRFKTPTDQKRTIEKIKKGRVDIIIGTHRLLSKDIVYKDLGLLIIDEEQRFGVAHKEKIKQLKADVDVLTLTATPIPRTLHMSLIGIRDMSILEEPPVDRYPIQTYVLEKNDEIIREAINREMARDGQIYYVYNRVKDIDEVASKIKKIVPDATVAVAHGQMSEKQLERIMFDFINNDIDVLVATTIIETGLDIPNVNTIIIDDADRLGLSQLYQLRGRVGRSNRTSYAFLMYRRNKVLKEIAEKRLQAIKEFTELGSGIKIAMRDLQIRGAGNILGAKQSGHLEAVGYDLYVKMLNQAIRALKGDYSDKDIFETTVDMNVDAFIPNTYITNESEKLDIYKRIAEIENEEEFFDMQDELIDRFGDIPQSVNNLLKIALLKSEAHDAYVTEFTYRNNVIKMIMYDNAKIKVDKIPELVNKYKPCLKLHPEAPPYFTYTFEVKKKTKVHNMTRPMSKRANSLIINKEKANKQAKDDGNNVFELSKSLLADIKGLLLDEK